MTEMTEAQWRRTIVDLATTLNWKCYCVENSTREIRRRSGAVVRVRNVNTGGVGFPDLVMARRGRLIFAELKRGKRRAGGAWQVTDEQRAWMAELTTVPCVEVFVWSPKDFDAATKVLA